MSEEPLRPIPSADGIPAHPACWYLFASCSELERGPISKELLGRRLVAYRTAPGQVAVLDARCSHLGADLGRGRVVSGRLECPFHAWEYGPNGRCVCIPGVADVPPFARLQAYPAIERHGQIFYFNGAQPLFPLPFFAGERPEDFVAASPLFFRAQCPWYMVAANGFDARHLTPIHGRELISEPQIEKPAPCAIQIQYRSRVTGRSLYDRLLRRFVGETVEVSISNWGGALILVTAFFRRARSYLLFSVRPVTARSCLVAMIVFLRRPAGLAGGLLGFLALWIRQRFSRAFVSGDFQQLAGIAYNPATLVAGDHELAEFFAWLGNVPHESLKPVAGSGEEAEDASRDATGVERYSI